MLFYLFPRIRPNKFPNHSVVCIMPPGGSVPFQRDPRTVFPVALVHFHHAERISDSQHVQKLQNNEQKCAPDCVPSINMPKSQKENINTCSQLRCILLLLCTNGSTRQMPDNLTIPGFQSRGVSRLSSKPHSNTKKLQIYATQPYKYIYIKGIFKLYLGTWECLQRTVLQQSNHTI